MLIISPFCLRSTNDLYWGKLLYSTYFLKIIVNKECLESYNNSYYWAVLQLESNSTTLRKGVQYRLGFHGLGYISTVITINVTGYCCQVK